MEPTPDSSSTDGVRTQNSEAGTAFVISFPDVIGEHIQTSTALNGAQLRGSGQVAHNLERPRAKRANKYWAIS